MCIDTAGDILEQCQEWIPDVYAGYTLTPTPIDYYINTENNTEQESNSGESSVSEEQKKKRRKVTINMVPFIAEKGEYMPPSCSFAEVRGSLGKLFNLGNSRDGGWKDDKSKEAFESLMQGVEDLYNSGPTSVAFTTWWGARDVDEKQWWNDLRITPIEHFIEYFEAGRGGIWTTNRTDEQARAHKKYTWKLVTHQDQLVTHQDQLLPKERYLCKLDRGAFSVLQSLCVPHTNTKWIAQSVGFGNLYTLSKLRSRKSTGGSGKGQTLAVKDGSGRSSDFGLIVYLFCLSKYICSVHYFKGNPEAASQEKQGTVPGVAGNSSSETSAQISGSLQQQQQCRTTARVLYKEFLFRGIYSSPKAFLRFLFSCLNEECNSLEITMPTQHEILRWLKEDKVLFKREPEQKCELNSSREKSNSVALLADTDTKIAVSAAGDSSPAAMMIKASGSQSSSSIEVEAVAVPSPLPRFVYILLGVLVAGLAFGVYALLQTVVEKQLVDSKNAALGPNFELAVIKTEASINAQFAKVLNDPFNQHFDLPKMVRSVKEKEEAMLLDQFRSYEAQGDLWQTVSYRTGKVVDNIETQVAEKQRGKYFNFYTSIYFVISL
jgi:hypothetical protein